MTEKKIMELYDQSPLNQRMRAYVIRKSDSEMARIVVNYPNDGMGYLKVWVFDAGVTPVQFGKVKGYGYDKLSAALRGLTVLGVVLCNDDHPWDLPLRNAGYEVISVL